jgi:hypothetical protein
MPSTRQAPFCGSPLSTNPVDIYVENHPPHPSESRFPAAGSGLPKEWAAKCKPLILWDSYREKGHAHVTFH